MGVVSDGVQRSVFASGALRGRETRIGPITIEVVEPLRVNDRPSRRPRRRASRAELTFTARTAGARGAAPDAPRRRAGRDGRRRARPSSAPGTGFVELAGETHRPRRVRLRDEGPLLGHPSRRRAHARPRRRPTPRNSSSCGRPSASSDGGLVVSRFEDAAGVPWSQAAATLDLLAAGASPADQTGVHHLRASWCDVDYVPGLRRASRCEVHVVDGAGVTSSVLLEPLLAFRMRGAGYFHPTFAHGRYHGELAVAGEVHDVADLDTTSLHDVHVQQVVRATWGERRGLGVLEQLAIGPHAPSGLTGLLDGAA